MCAANHAMQLYDRIAEDTRVSKGIVELMCEFSLYSTMFVIVLVRLCSYHVCSCTRASSVKLVEMVAHHILQS